jgi:uncharacterized repeat protein (TIGR03803 family)
MSNLLRDQRLNSKQVGARFKTAALTLVLMFGPALLASQIVHAQTYRVLHSFVAKTEGSYPFGNLIGDAAGNLYGTTNLGAVRPCSDSGLSYGCGSVFKLDASGRLTVLHAFTGGAGDGANSYANLVSDPAGNLYGTTYGGGANGWGTIFKVDASGTETVLHDFAYTATDGAGPYAGLVRDPAGNLYGTTFWGGSDGEGTAFKLDPSGNFTLLYSFTGSPNYGVQPYGGLILDSAGNLYGTDSGGGLGDGTVFEIDTSDTITVLYYFASQTDGALIFAPVERDSAGNLYGTSWVGGANNDGTVYKVDTAGNQTVLWNFTAGVDGARPQSGVVMDAAGNLYGTATTGGANGLGVVYKLDTTGNLTVLHAFAGGTDGATPYGGLLRGRGGIFYGTTGAGGAHSAGTVFAIKP